MPNETERGTDMARSTADVVKNISLKHILAVSNNTVKIKFYFITSLMKCCDSADEPHP